MESISKGNHSVVTHNGSVIIQDNTILLQNVQTHDCIYVPITDEVLQEFELETVQAQSEDTSDQSSSGSKIWSKENTLFLIEKVREFNKEFSCGIKKKVWEKVAEQCKHLHKNINVSQCETKWKTLKRTYKTVLLHNKTSGNKPRYWEYFDIMNDILYDKPEITPVATCSSLSGLQVNEKTDNISSNESDAKGDENEPPFNLKLTTSFSKKRKAKENDIERRHKEKIQRLDRFNDLLEKLIDKI